MMDNSFRSQISLFAIVITLAMATTAGCSAEQPPAETTEAAVESAAADVAAASASVAADAEQLAEKSVEQMAEAVAAPTKVAASDEEPPAQPIVVAQAAIDEEQDESEVAAEAKVVPPSGPAPYRVGDHYSVLSPAQPTSSDPGKVEITEFFMYGCPHCYNFEAFLEKWSAQKAPYVQFVRFPALFNRTARIHARAFYTAETLGILNDTHMAFFRELHVNRKAMTSEDDIAAFFANYGVDGEAFRQAYNSFAVDTQIRKAEALGRRYRITSTPTVIVNGKYVVDGDKVTSYEEILKIADYLAQKEASGG